MANLATRQDVIEFEKRPLPELPHSTYEVLANSARKYPNRTALHFFLQSKDYKKPASWTYEQLLGDINATANMFRDLGIGEQDVVTYILPNSPETMLTVYGAQAAGIVNAINPLLEPAQMADIMKAAGTNVLVTLAPFPKTDIWGKVSTILGEVPSIKTVITLNLGKYLGLVPQTLTQLTTEKAKVGGEIRLLDFHQTVKKYPKDRLTFQRNIQPDDMASYFHTGGTTGRPKIAQHTHRNEVTNAWTINNMLDLEGYKVFFCGLPWFHVNGVIVTGLTPFTGGHGVVLGTPAGYRSTMDNFWEIVEHYQVSFFSSVPTVLQYLLNVPIAGQDISSLEYAFCGAAPLSVKLFNDFEATTGIKILEGYGFTEGSCANSANPPYGKRKIGSIGLAMAHHHMKIAILDANGHYLRDADTNEIGNIVARGVNLFPGYKEEIHNKKIWIHDGQHRWYNTGDLGRQDEDGYFWITGRKKELIIRGGHNIDPKSIEEPMSHHPAVAAVAAVARPDKRLGELPAAYIQLKPNKTATVDELLTYAREHIRERAAVPKFLYLIDELPLTAVGKVFKPDLVKKQVKEVFGKELSAIDQIQQYTIDVVQDPKKGMVAQIKATPKAGTDRKRLNTLVQDALGSYTIKYELV